MTHCCTWWMAYQRDNSQTATAIKKQCTRERSFKLGCKHFELLSSFHSSYKQVAD